VVPNELAYFHRLKTGYRIVSIVTDTHTFTTPREIATALHTAVGTVRIITMPIVVFDNISKPPEYL
jgi:hypothetical protein